MRPPHFDQAFDTLVDRLARIITTPPAEQGRYEARMALLEAKYAFRDAVRALAPKE